MELKRTKLGVKMTFHEEQRKQVRDIIIKWVAKIFIGCYLVPLPAKIQKKIDEGEFFESKELGVKLCLAKNWFMVQADKINSEDLIAHMKKNIKELE